MKKINKPTLQHYSCYKQRCTVAMLTIIVTLLLLLFVMMGCSKEPDATNMTSHAISTTLTGVGPTTRITNGVLDDGESFGILAYSCPTGSFDPATSLPDLLYNARVEKYTSENVAGYRYIPSAHWPSMGKVQFAVYYPHSESVAPGAITVSPATSSGLPEYTIVMGLQQGKLDFATHEVGPVARVFDGSDPADTPIRLTNYVNFVFKRQMAYLSFRARVINMDDARYRLYINNVTIRNIYTRAVYGNVPAGRGWKNQGGLDGVSGATIKVSALNVPIDKTEFRDIINPNTPAASTPETITMLPQVYDGVELRVAYTLEYLLPTGGCEYYVSSTRNVRLSSDWQAGKQYIYDLEFAFSDVTASSPLLNFTVNQWIENNIDTEI